jgi:dTDP-4-amino-4,6-dideoxygalactose transaminase
MIIKDNAFKATPQEFMDTENRFRNVFGEQEVFWVGRAATSFLLAYNAVKYLKPSIAQPEVILPAVSCATPSNTAAVCGLTIRFADINIENGLVDINDIKKKVTANTIAIVYIHLYGNTHPRDIVDLKAFCREKGIFLIEDVAQSLGATINSTLISGTVGDFSIFSFNKTKIFETGGGALTVRNAEVLDAVMKGNDLKNYNELSPARSSELALSYRNLHHALVAEKKKDAGKDISTDFLLKRADYAGLYYKEEFNYQGFLKEFDQLDAKLEQRLEKAELYKAALQQVSDFSILKGWENSKCCWRFSFLVNFPDQAAEFSEMIRKDGFHVSNLYWPVNQFFNPADNCPNADFFARRIINLWVNEEVSVEWVKSCITSIELNLKKIRA